MLNNQLIAMTITGKLTGSGIQVADNFDATTQFEKYAGQLVGMLTIVAVLYFVAQIIFAGYAFIASQGDEKTMESTRKRLTEAVLGLVIVVVAVGLGSLIALLLGIPSVLDIGAMFTKMGLK